MRRALRTLSAVTCIGVCALALRAEPAQACGACECPSEWVGSTLLWTGGAPTTATNAHILMVGFGEDATLETFEGEPAAARVEPAGVPDAFFLVPEMPLQPRRTYVIRSTATGEQLAQFVTADGPADLDPPVLIPPEPAEARDVSFYCGATVALPMLVPNGMNGGLLRVEVEDATHAQTLFVSADSRHIALLRPFAIDGDDCAGPLGVDFLVAGQVYDVHISRLDAVGRFSDSVALALTAVNIETAGCTDGGTCAVAAVMSNTKRTPWSMLALMAVGATARVRRRSRGPRVRRSSRSVANQLSPSRMTRCYGGERARDGTNHREE